MSHIKSKIISTGSYRPKQVITNDDFAQIMDTTDEWITQRTGIKTRYFEGISTANMATKAALNAIDGIDVDTIDCIVVGTYTPDSFIPSVANIVRANLGITKAIPSFDVNAACSGFLYALQVANALIKSSLYRRVLVIGADFNSRYLNYRDRSTAILFGDGAGAVLLDASDAGIFDLFIGGESDEIGAINVANATDIKSPFVERAINQSCHFDMKGAEVFKFAVRIVDSMIQECIKRNDITTADIDYVIAHQANQRILAMAARSLKIDKTKFLSNVAEVGNTSSASVPLLLDEANKKGLLKPGMKILLLAFGGGLTYGCALIEWSN
ncbi:MAG: beta-ketoacyl-ACP synthase III [Erysipelotrichaceae bacterium]